MSTYQGITTGLLHRLIGKPKAQIGEGLFAPSLMQGSQPQNQVVQGTALTPRAPQSQSPLLNLCETLKSSRIGQLGTLQTQANVELCLLDVPVNVGSASSLTDLVPLSTLLESHSRHLIDLSREERFNMAANIACAFMQVQRSPWLSRHWT